MIANIAKGNGPKLLDIRRVTYFGNEAEKSRRPARIEHSARLEVNERRKEIITDGVPEGEVELAAVRARSGRHGEKFHRSRLSKFPTINRSLLVRWLGIAKPQHEGTD